MTTLGFYPGVLSNLYYLFMDVVLQIITIIFWFIVILLPLVAIHEFGHLLMARLVGVRVVEYGIGIPPRFKYFRWKGIVWSLNYVLLGGFARIYGDHDAIDEANETARVDEKKAKEQYIPERLAELVSNQEIKFFLEENNLEFSKDWEELEKSKYLKGIESPLETEKRAGFEALTKQLTTLIEWEYETKIIGKEAFFAKKYWQQVLILLGGVTFNLISAVIFLWLMFGVTGSTTQYAFTNNNEGLKKYAEFSYQSEFVKAPQILKDSPAANLGMKPGDDLIRIAGTEINTLGSIDEFRDLVSKNKDQTVSVVYRSKETGEIIEKTTTFAQDNGRVYFGINGLGYEVRYKAKDFGAGFQLAVSQTYDYFILNFKALGQIGTALLPQTQDRSALEYVNGPIAVSSLSSRVAREFGFAGILLILALISVGLAAFNLLPVPALDGGRIVILTINKILGKRNKRWEAVAISVTFIFILLLGILIAFRDVQGVIAGKY